MKRIRTTGLFIFLWAALTCAAGARAAAVDNVAGAILVTLFWALVNAASLRDARNREDLPPKQLTDTIAMIGLGVFMLEFLLGNALQALMTLLLWLQTSRNLTLRTRRDAYFALLVSLTLIIFGAAETRSTIFLLVIVAYGLAALGVLVYCHQQSGFDNESPQGQASAAGPLWSLSLRHLLALTAAVFLAAAAWYLLVPRPAAINFGVVPSHGGKKYSRSDWVQEARNGSARQVESESRDPGGDASERPAETNPGSAKRDQRLSSDGELDITRSDHGGKGTGDKGDKGDKRPANAIVMYVQTDRMLYLRERSYDHFENNRWSSSEKSTRKLLPNEGRFDLSAPGVGEKVEYMAQVVSDIGSALPLSAHATTLNAPAGVIAQGADGAVYLASQIDADFRYSAISLLPKDSERPIEREVLVNRSRYLQKPDGFSSRIGDLAQQVSANAQAPFDKALALEFHLRNAYAYSFDTVFTSQNVTPLEDFLFVTRRGHCEFFASAMAMMLREVGIPSRVVHGFLAHSFNPTTGYYEVRAFDGHAWVEAYFEGAGWITFEPTAAYPVPQRQMQSGTTLADLKTYTEKLAQQEALQGEKGVMQNLSDLFRRLTEVWYLLLFQLWNWLDALQSWARAHAVLLIGGLTGGALAGAAIHRQRVRLFWLWARLVMLAVPSAKVPLAAFRQLERLARARKLGRAAHETVEEYLARVAAIYPELGRELPLLQSAFNAARYDGRQISSTEAENLLHAFQTVGMALVLRQGQL